MVIILLFPTLPVLNQISLYSIFILVLLSIWSSSFLLALSWIFFGQLLNDLYSYIVVGGWGWMRGRHPSINLGLKLEPSSQVQVTSFPDPHGFSSLNIDDKKIDRGSLRWILFDPKTVQLSPSLNTADRKLLNIIRSQNCSFSWPVYHPFLQPVSHFLFGWNLDWVHLDFWLERAFFENGKAGWRN